MPRRPPAPKPLLPSARDLALPRAARDTYDRLLAEPHGDPADLLPHVRAHLARFEAARARNEFIPLADARRLAEALPVLVAFASQELRDREAARPPPGDRRPRSLIVNGSRHGGGVSHGAERERQMGAVGGLRRSAGGPPRGRSAPTSGATRRHSASLIGVKGPSTPAPRLR